MMDQESEYNELLQQFNALDSIVANMLEVVKVLESNWKYFEKGLPLPEVWSTTEESDCVSLSSHEELCHLSMHTNKENIPKTDDLESTPILDSHVMSQPLKEMNYHISSNSPTELVKISEHPADSSSLYNNKENIYPTPDESVDNDIFEYKNQNSHNTSWNENYGKQSRFIIDHSSEFKYVKKFLSKSLPLLSSQPVQSDSPCCMHKLKKNEAKEIMDELQNCDGSNIRKLVLFIQKIDELMECFPEYKDFILRRIKMKCSGTFRKWWVRNIGNNEKWDDIKKLIHSEYISDEKMKYLTYEMINERLQRPDEPFLDYVEDIRSKCKALGVNISDEAFIQKVLYHKYRDNVLGEISPLDILQI